MGVHSSFARMLLATTALSGVSLGGLAALAPVAAQSLPTGGAATTGAVSISS